MPISVQPTNIPPPQVSVSQFPNVAIAGQTVGFPRIISKIADAATGVGIGVCTGASNGTTALPAASTDITAHFQGVVVQSTVKEPVGPIGGTLLAPYRAGEQLPILRQGAIWVVAEDTLVDDGSVFCVFAVTDTRTIGTFVASALAGTSAALVPNAKVRIGGVGTHAAPCLCLVDFNLIG